MAMGEQQLTTKENIVEYFSEALDSLVPKTLIETELQEGKAEGVVTPKAFTAWYNSLQTTSSEAFKKQVYVDRRKSNRVILSPEQMGWVLNLASSGQSAISVSKISCRWSSCVVVLESTDICVQIPTIPSWHLDSISGLAL